MSKKKKRADTDTGNNGPFVGTYPQDESHLYDNKKHIAASIATGLVGRWKIIILPYLGMPFEIFFFVIFT